MELFDYIIMAVGSSLIIIGLFLFISGKKESAKGNQLEGFGIKLNVSNPSILLIVFGIGLLLVPRLLPNPPVESATAPSPSITVSPITEPPAQAQPQAQPQAQAQVQPQAQPQAESASAGLIAQPVEQAEVVPVYSPPPSVFLPAGVWQLSGYEENGMDYSGNAQASINFVGQSPTNTAWAANYVFADVLGNVSNYQYQGLISGNGSAYNMAITASNDPDFFAQGAIPLDLFLEDGGVLHMEYVYNGTSLILHWMQ